MLPAIKLGKPKTEFWLGLIDGVYAIAMTLAALELPVLTARIHSIYVENQFGFLKILFFIASEVLAYVISFLVLYEIWSFHKASICIGGLSQRGQNFLNSLILVSSCLVSGQMIYILNQKYELLSELDLKSSELDTIKSLVIGSVHTYNYIIFYTLCLLCFLLINILTSKSQKISSSNDLLIVSKATIHRICIFSLFIILTILCSEILPCPLLMICYLCYSFYEKD